MKKYYPAIFTPENKGYSARFPDVSGCYTCGDNLEQTVGYCSDAIRFMF